MSAKIAIDEENFKDLDYKSLKINDQDFQIWYTDFLIKSNLPEKDTTPHKVRKYFKQGLSVQEALIEICDQSLM